MEPVPKSELMLRREHLGAGLPLLFPPEDVEFCQMATVRSSLLALGLPPPPATAPHRRRVKEQWRGVIE